MGRMLKEKPTEFGKRVYPDEVRKKMLSLDTKTADSTVVYSYVLKAKITKRFAGNPGRLLDLGCGWGREIVHYENGVGQDINLSKLKDAKQFSNNDFVCADAEYLPFCDGCFGSVIMTEVIEHLQNPHEVIDEVKRVLKEKGKVVISTPNKGVIRSIYKPKFHIHGFTVSELTNLLYKNGFKVLKRTGSTIPFIPHEWKRIYHINFNKIFFFLWRILNTILPMKWDIIILARAPAGYV